MPSCTGSGILFHQGTEGSSNLEQRIPLNSAQAGVAAEEGEKQISGVSAELQQPEVEVLEEKAGELKPKDT